MKTDLEEAVRVMRDWTADLNADSPVMRNLAKREAGQLLGRMVYILGAGLFAEVARRWRAQIAANAKTWAACEALPEANHHAIAGLDWPDGFASKVMALFLTGQADHPRNAQRVQLTQQAYMMAGCNTDFIAARGEQSAGANDVAGAAGRFHERLSGAVVRRRSVAGRRALPSSRRR